MTVSNKSHCLKQRGNQGLTLKVDLYTCTMSTHHQHTQTHEHAYMHTSSMHVCMHTSYTYIYHIYVHTYKDVFKKMSQFYSSSPLLGGSSQ